MVEAYIVVWLVLIGVGLFTLVLLDADRRALQSDWEYEQNFKIAVFKATHCKCVGGKLWCDKCAELA